MAKIQGKWTADTISHEAGHIYGLAHIQSTPEERFLMETGDSVNSPYSDTEFCDTPQPLLKRPLLPWMSKTQNSREQLENKLGISEYAYTNLAATQLQSDTVDSPSSFTGELAPTATPFKITLQESKNLYDVYVFLSKSEEDFAPTMITKIDEMPNGTHEILLEQPLFYGDQLLFVASSAPGQPPDVFAMNKTKGFDPRNISEGILRDYGAPIEQMLAGVGLRILSYEGGGPEQVGYMGAALDVNCDIDENGKFDGRDVRQFVLGCGRATTEAAWCKLHAKSQGKQWYDKKCPAEGVPWLCDVNNNGWFDYRDVAEYQKQCKVR